MKKYLLVWLVLTLALAGCDFQLVPTPQPAMVTVTFDLYGGGTGFAAMIYAQEISSGKTFKILYPAGSHGGVVLPTSPPVVLKIDTPGSYVFYANFNENPDEYHFGYNGCRVRHGLFLAGTQGDRRGARRCLPGVYHPAFRPGPDPRARRSRSPCNDEFTLCRQQERDRSCCLHKKAGRASLATHNELRCIFIFEAKLQK